MTVCLGAREAWTIQSQNAAGSQCIVLVDEDEETGSSTSLQLCWFPTGINISGPIPSQPTFKAGFFPRVPIHAFLGHCTVFLSHYTAIVSFSSSSTRVSYCRPRNAKVMLSK